jgi:glycosyltransferase involved in cell wall biosynthesis
MGGAETSLLEILSGVRKLVPDWDLWLVLAEEGILGAKARELGVQVKTMPFPPALARLGEGTSLRPTVESFRAAAFTALYAKRLGAVLRHLKPHLIHSNGFKMHVLGGWTCPKKTPLLWHIHDYVSSRRIMSRMLRWSSNGCTAVIANSASVAADLRTVLPGLNSSVVYNAVDLDRYTPNGRTMDLDAACGLSPLCDGTIRVGLVGTFARWKGHKVFLQALSKLPRNAPIRGYIIGGPIYQTNGSQWTRNELEQEVERLGLAGRVGFTGTLLDPAPAMRSLDIVVHASTEPEPFGMVIIEAMATGKALIASRAGGACELFVDGESALSHPPGEADALCKQIMRLTHNQDQRVRLGAAARTQAVKIFGRERLAKELVAMYDHVSGKARLSPKEHQGTEPDRHTMCASLEERR